MTLIVGATGTLGLEICRQLRAAGQDVRALVRATSDAGKRAELARLGAELVEGDLKDPLSIRRACTGVRAVVSTASSTLSRQAGDSIQTVDEQGQLTLVDAAKQAGVDHFVFVSFRDNPQIRFPLTLRRRRQHAQLGFISRCRSLCGRSAGGAESAQSGARRWWSASLEPSRSGSHVRSSRRATDGRTQRSEVSASIAIRGGCRPAAEVVRRSDAAVRAWRRDGHEPHALPASDAAGLGSGLCERGVECSGKERLAPAARH
jgi:hypothetical protein